MVAIAIYEKNPIAIVAALGSAAGWIHAGISEHELRIANKQLNRTGV